MSELSPKTRDALLRVGTSTLTGVLNRRGLRTMFMQDVWPIRHDIPRMVGVAFTMRFIPSREDKDGPGARGRGQIQSQAMETCPPGHVLVVDSRGDPRAASAGDLYVGRLKARGYAGIVTDGGLRDTDGIFNPTFATRPSKSSRALIFHGGWFEGRHHNSAGHTGNGTCAAITLGGGWAGKLNFKHWSRMA